MNRSSDPPPCVHVLALITDAHGSLGGIAQYNRDFLQALSLSNHTSSIDVVPRLYDASGVASEGEFAVDRWPPKVTYRLKGLGGVLRWSLHALKVGLLGARPGLVVCGHLNLLPVAWLVARLRGAPLVLLIYGIDVWRPSNRAITNRLARNVDWVASISEVTLGRFAQWCRIRPDRTAILPNAIHLEQYGVGEKSPDLVARYGLEGKRVLMTLGRMVGKDRAKGFDEVIDLMPRLVAEDPSIVYLAAGRGPDRQRLESRAATLGMERHVIFTGLVPEERKADYFRLADAYVMPSRGEGFGFVILEAMACGVPAIASTSDGGFEAILKGELGIAVGPDDDRALLAAILEAIKRPKAIPPGLSYFAFPRFAERVDQLLGKMLAGTKGQSEKGSDPLRRGRKNN